MMSEPRWIRLTRWFGELPAIAQAPTYDKRRDRDKTYRRPQASEEGT